MSNWFEFLQARRCVINEFRLEGKSCTEIARILSMDPGQVYLISTVENEAGPVPEDASRAIIESRDRAMKILERMPDK